MAGLGILTHRITNPSRFDLLAEEAERLGFEYTVLFTPRRILFSKKQILAFCRRGGRWQETVVPYPDIVHDAGYYARPQTIKLVKRFKAEPGVVFTGYGLGHKWNIQRHLLRTDVADYLPETALYDGPETVVSMAKRYGAVMLKPRNGKGGVGIVKIERKPGASAPVYYWHQSNGFAPPLRLQALRRRLAERYALKDVLVQRWMDIRDRKGRVFDIRALMQKQPDGGWCLSALGVRQAEEGRIASNLRAGGTVHEVFPFLRSQYGEAKAEELSGEMVALAHRIAERLEAVYEKPFIELGIDLAVERGGTLRIIEVNIKPGKKIVRALSGEKAYADALTAPIRYAAARAGVRKVP